MDQIFNCFKCSKPLPVEYTGRRDTCPSCGSDVRVCKNCSFFDSSAYNECHEIQAERVVDKERANFCDYFRPRIGGRAQASTEREDALKKLDDLFKQ
jgi:rRNA maturation protein Nop10